MYKTSCHEITLKPFPPRDEMYIGIGAYIPIVLEAEAPFLMAVTSFSHYNLEQPHFYVVTIVVETR